MTEEQIQQRCKELFEEELKVFEEIHIRADYFYHPVSSSLDIFIVVRELGSFSFIEYRLDKETLEVIKREQLISGPGTTDILRPVLSW